MTTEVITLGCRLNDYESAVMRENAEKNGTDGDILVVNTCAVTAEAMRQARQTIRKAKRENPKRKIVVTGCAAQIDPEMFAAMPETDKVIGNHEKLAPTAFKDLFSTENSEKIRVNDIMSVRETAGHMVSAAYSDKTRAYLQVQNGCDHRCTFCVIPYGRGNSRSVPAGVVTEQIKRSVGEGVAEIVLTGVDLTAWGADLPGAPRLGNLVGRILKTVPDLKRLRLSSVDSPEIDPELYEYVTGERRFTPYLHLSLQSGDNMILKRMKRRHNREQAIDLAADLRSKRPDIAFGADIIAGFPTETEAMFDNSLKLIRDVGIAYAHIFPYSPRPGTPAARMPQVEKSVIKRRAAELRAAARDYMQEFLQSRIGKTEKALIEKDGTGRAENFAKITFEKRHATGSIIDTRITGADHDTLRGVEI